ncbi:MAG: Uncharacterised protein [SAR92 bacterium MED-G29]|jgi:hypothetical protein|nr:MAG: Uncharacterised protein [SAR92 bacterium MED-G29]|tara:strand:+ start:1014 stop:1202 length:189 start_codon:yes stop_codon:yes gene_type:complete
MENPKYNKAQNARIDEWLTLCSQSNIKVGSEGYFQIIAMIADDDQIVIDTVIEALSETERFH